MKKFFRKLFKKETWKHLGKGILNIFKSTLSEEEVIKLVINSLDIPKSIKEGVRLNAMTKDGVKKILENEIERLIRKHVPAKMLKIFDIETLVDRVIDEVINTFRI